MGVDDKLITAHRPTRSGCSHGSRSVGTERRPKADAKPKNASKSQKAN